MPGWKYDARKRAIWAEFVLKDFVAAVRMIGRIAKMADKADHHPDLHLTRYRRLKVVLTTHNTGGVTMKDLNLAKKIGLPMAILGMATLLTGCSPEFQKTFETSFKKSFRANFIKSCVKDDTANQQKVDYCTCCADQALEQLTVKQLMNMKEATEYIKNKVVPGCMEKVGVVPIESQQN